MGGGEFSQPVLQTLTHFSDRRLEVRRLRNGHLGQPMRQRQGGKAWGMTPAPCTSSLGVAGKEIRRNLTVSPPAGPPVRVTSQHISSPGNLELPSSPSFVSLRSSEHCPGDAAGSSNSFNPRPSPGWTPPAVIHWVRSPTGSPQHLLRVCLLRKMKQMTGFSGAALCPPLHLEASACLLPGLPDHSLAWF